MRNSRTARFVAVLAVGSLLAAGCASDDETTSDSTTTVAEAPSNDRGNVDGELVIGQLLPESGDLQVIFDSLSVPIEIAVAEINDAGGVLGKNVVIKAADDGTSPEVAKTGYDQLTTSEKVDVILGPASSGANTALAEKVKTDGVPMCTGSATSAALSTIDWGGYWFRTAPSDNLQGPALAQVLIDDGKSKPVIIARKDAYGEGFADALNGALGDEDATVSEPVLYDPEGTTFDGEVDQVLALTPDAVVVLGFIDDGAKIVQEMIKKGAGPDKVAIYTADGMQSSGFGATVDPANPGVVSGIKGTAPAGAPSGIVHPFTAVFEAKNVDPIFSAYYYDCAIIFALASQASASDDGTKIAEAVNGVVTGDEDCNTFVDCKKLLEDGKTIAYKGASQNFDGWQGFEPGSGTYDQWSYDAAGKVVTEAEQIKVGATE